MNGHGAHFSFKGQHPHGLHNSGGNQHQHMAERFHQRFFKAVPLPEGTSFRSRTEEMGGFNVAGPKSRELLQRLTNADLSSETFPFMSKATSRQRVHKQKLAAQWPRNSGPSLGCNPATLASVVAKGSARPEMSETNESGNGNASKIAQDISRRGAAPQHHPRIAGGSSGAVERQ